MKPSLQGSISDMVHDQVIGTEVEYGITIMNDPAFNPVAASAALVNAHAHGADRIKWSYDEESPGATGE